MRIAKRAIWSGASLSTLPRDPWKVGPIPIFMPIAMLLTPLTIRWRKNGKPGNSGDIKRDAEYYEAAFHARLAKKIGELGYAVGRSGEWWEIKGLSREHLENFSQRTEKIEAAAKEGAIDDAAAKDKLAARTRENKVKTSMSDLEGEWADRLTSDEKESLSRLLGHRQEQVITSRESMDYALAHCHERASVVPDKALVTEALWHGIGQVEVAQVERRLLREEILTQDMDGRRWCTTKDVLREEWENIDFVKKDAVYAARLIPSLTRSRTTNSGRIKKMPSGM